MVSHQEHLDFGDEFNADPFDADPYAPPTPEEQQAMLEHISVMQAIAFLRDRGIRVDADEVAS